MRPEVSPCTGAKSAKDVKTSGRRVEEITKGIPEVIKQWRETFGVYASERCHPRKVGTRTSQKITTHSRMSQRRVSTA